jgi:copper chaperone CopZ
MKSVTLKIQGMHCGGCARTIQTLLERQPGVRSAAVRFESGEARVVFDPTVLDEQSLVALLEQPGYHAAVQVAG